MESSNLSRLREVDRDSVQFGLEMSQQSVTPNRTFPFRDTHIPGVENLKQPVLPHFGTERILDHSFPRMANLSYEQYSKNEGYQQHPFYGGTSAAYYGKGFVNEPSMIRRKDSNADSSVIETINVDDAISDQPINATMKPDRVTTNNAPLYRTSEDKITNRDISATITKGLNSSSGLVHKAVSNSGSSYVQPKVEPVEYPHHSVHSNMLRNQVPSYNQGDDCTEDNSSEQYICGCCMLIFTKMCLLHTHLKTHDCEGSYVFNHTTNTAYPKLEVVCIGTQTHDLSWADLTSRDDGEETAQTDNLDDIRDNTRDDKETPETVIKATTRKKKRTHAASEKVNHVKTKVSGVKQTFVTKKGRKRKSSETDNKYAKRKQVKDDIDDMESEDNTCTDVCVKVEPGIEDSATEDEDNDNDEDFKALMEDSCDTDGYDVDEYADLELKVRSYNKTGKPRKKRVRAFLDYYVQKDKQYICKLCDDVCEGYRKFIHHFKESHPEFAEPEKKLAGSSRSKPMECMWCGETFPSAKACIDHVRECESNQRLKCQICDQRFGTVQEVKSHIHTHQNIELSCKKCTKAFTNALYFHNHLLRHAEVKNEQCEHCGKYVNGGRTLANHLRNCSREQNLPCPHCDRLFKTQHALKFHLAVHSDERPFVCHICGYAGTVMITFYVSCCLSELKLMYM